MDGTIEGEDAMATVSFSGCQVFSATKARDREDLGGRVTAWLRERPGLEVVDAVVTQSSDREFHCIAITVFYKDEEG